MGAVSEVNRTRQLPVDLRYPGEVPRLVPFAPGLGFGKVKELLRASWGIKRRDELAEDLAGQLRHRFELRLQNRSAMNVMVHG